jgi:hypothetical protein
MNWREYLKSQGYSDAEIGNMATTFGEDKMSKAFAEPISKLAEAQTLLTEAERKDTEFRDFYEKEVMPKIGSTYKDAINARTENAALKARLEAAKEYGFLNDEIPGTVTVPGSPAGRPVVAANPVPGSPGAPGAPPSDFDPNQYVRADKFTEAVNSIPDMLGRLADVSNEYYRLYGQPIPDRMNDLIDEARRTKKTVGEIAAAKYKFTEKRAEIDQAKAAAHDKEVADAAVRDYASKHQMPFTAPGVVSRSPMFEPKSQDEARKPWQGARDRKQERRQAMVDAMNGKPVTARPQ